MKFEGSGSKGTRVIERKRSVTDGQTDSRTDGQTDKAKTICLPQRGGDIINQSINHHLLLVFVLLSSIVNHGHNIRVVVLKTIKNQHMIQ